MAQLIDSRSTRTEAPILCWRNRLSGGTATATDEATGFPASAALTYATYEGWQPASSFSLLDVALATAAPIDYICVVCEGGADDSFVSVETSDDSGSTYSPVDASDCPMFWPAQFGVLLFVFDERDAVTHLRVVLRSCNTSAFRVANVMAGLRTELPRNLYVGHSPATLNRQTELTTNQSENGAFLGRIVRRRSQGSQVSMQNVTAANARSLIHPFFEAAETQPFVFAWRPSTSAPPGTANHSFESGDTGWTKGTGWVIENDQPNAVRGSWLARYTGGLTASIDSESRIAVAPGDRVYVTGRVRVDSGSLTMTMRIGWTNDLDVEVATSDVNGITGSSYALSYGSALAPSAARQAEARCVATFGGGANATGRLDTAFIYVPSALRDAGLQEVSWGWMEGNPQIVPQRPNGMMQFQFAFRGLAQ